MSEHRAAGGGGCAGLQAGEPERGERRGSIPWGRGAPGRQERGRCAEVKTENKKLPGEMTDSPSTRHPWQRRAQGGEGAPRPSRDPGLGIGSAYLVRRRARSSRGASAAQCPDIASAVCSGFYFAGFLNLEDEHSAISFKTDIQPSEWRYSNDMTFLSVFSSF